MEDLTLTKVWEAYKDDSSRTVYARTKGLAKRFGCQLIGSMNTVNEVEIFISKEDRKRLKNNKYIIR